MKSARNGISGFFAIILFGFAIVTTIVLILRLSPPESASGRAATEAKNVILDAPNQIRKAIRDARERLDRAKVAFRSARVESEKALVNQLQEAKERGSVPPL